MVNANTATVITDILGDLIAISSSNTIPAIIGIFQRHGVTDEQLHVAAANNANVHLVRDAVIAAGGKWPETAPPTQPPTQPGAQALYLVEQDHDPRANVAERGLYKPEDVVWRTDATPPRYIVAPGFGGFPWVAPEGAVKLGTFAMPAV